MNSSILNLEANYNDSYQRYKRDPTDEKWKELVKKQITIDDVRASEQMNTRWYTRKEIKEFVESDMDMPENPREPLEIPEDDKETEWAEKSRYAILERDVNYYSLRLDVVIEKLQDIRDEMGGDIGVWYQGASMESEGILKIILDENRVLLS